MTPANSAATANSPNSRLCIDEENKQSGSFQALQAGLLPSRLLRDFPPKLQNTSRIDSSIVASREA